MPPITIVSATRHNEKDFLERSALGRSLRTYAVFGVKARICFENARGLGACYNQAIDQTDDDDEILVFVHDDVTIADFFWIDKLMLGLQRFDVVGLAGNKRRIARQPAWAGFVDDKLTWDDRANLSGIVGHGDGFPCAIDVFGDVMQPLKLMDGVLLATRKKHPGPQWNPLRRTVQLPFLRHGHLPAVRSQERHDGRDPARRHPRQRRRLRQPRMARGI